jgi:heat shock protein HslJ
MTSGKLPEGGPDLNRYRPQPVLAWVRGAATGSGDLEPVPAEGSMGRLRMPVQAGSGPASALFVLFAGLAMASTPESGPDLGARSVAPGILGITWRAEDIDGRGIIDSSRATLLLGADGSVSGVASCNAYSGRYVLEGGRLDFAGLSLASRKSCAPSLMKQERRFVEVLGAVQRIDLLPTGALLLSGPGRQSLRFFPETSP